MNIVLKLALAYAEKHPDQIVELIQAGVDRLIASLRHAAVAK